MKVTTEKLPKSLLALEIELDRERFERGLDKAARRLSQKYPVHGFRPGKAPRAIIERTFGRAALVEDATDDLINKAYREALDQEKITPIGPPNLEEISSADPFIFRVTVPVAPTVTVGDYQAIRVPLESDLISDEQVESELERRRDKHVVLKELDEPRPAQEGDQLKVNLDTIFEDDEDDDDDDDEDDDEDRAIIDDAGEVIADVEDAAADDPIIDDTVIDQDGEIVDEDDGDEGDDDEDDDEDDEDEDDEDDEGEEQTLDLVPGRLVDELHNALIGLSVGERAEVTATMPDDHGNAEVRGKTVTFKVKVNSIQERILPDWDEMPTLENFEGSLDGLREKVRGELETAARTAAERKVTESYIEQLVAGTTYDIPDVMVRELADEMLHDQGRQFERYGITLDQMLQYRGKTHDEAVEELMPDAEKQTRVTLALREVVQHEQIQISNEEIDAEVARMALDYDDAARPNVAQTLATQMRSNVANVVLDRKLRERLVQIATAAEEPAAEEPAAEEPAAE